MGYALYVSHPEVLIEPHVPVPQWSLSEKGRQRVKAFAPKLAACGFGRIVSSDETKALETAELLGQIIGVAVQAIPEMGENDRSATGFVPPEHFERLADAFFAQPEISIRGWETARAAQIRIVNAVNRVLATHGRATPILFIGHGAVGTLLQCHLKGAPIDRRHDQNGAGNCFAFALASGKLLCEWTAMENWEHGQWPS